MLNLNEYDPNAVTPGGTRRYFSYEGFFGGYLLRDGFGLHGMGSLSLDTPEHRINLMGETPLPMFITVPLSLIPIVGRAIRTFYRPQGDFRFQFADVTEFARKGRQIQFKAPKREGGKPKRIEFLAKTDAEADQIESCIRHYKPEITAGKMVSSWRLMKYALTAAGILVGLFMLLLIGAGIKRYAEKPADLYATINTRLSGNPNRKPVTKFSEMNKFPETANGILKSGGHIFLIATIAPDGSVSDVKVSEKHNDGYFPNTTNQILIEDAMNQARKIKYTPDKDESRIELWFRYTTRLDNAFMR